jgi:osomolarity two-component system sensor histidine kinase NIK1
MLNTLSIKKRLIILIFCPLLLLTVMIIGRVKESVFTLSQLNKLNHRVELLSESINLNESLHIIRVEKLIGNEIVPNTQAFLHSVNQLVRLAPKALQDDNSSMRLLNDLLSAEEDLASLTIEETPDWSTWISDSMSQVLLNLEKNSLTLLDIEINNNLYVLYQLQWLYFWANEENWYINLIVRDANIDVKDQLTTIVERQQLFIERFIAISADNDQISLLQDTFSEQVFIDSYALRNRIQNTNFDPHAADYDLSVLNKRLALIKAVISDVSNNMSVKIQKKVAESNMEIVASIILVTGALLCMGLLGVSIAKRILGNLNKIIVTLTQIEEKHDYSIKVDIDGDDEFSAFSTMLNKLIEERYVNERKIVQAKVAAEQANLAKSSFLANMSHEIRTPLNGVIGMSNILSGTKLTLSQQDHLAMIETSSQTLLMLINDILDFSKIESGRLTIANHKCNLREIIYDSLSIIMPDAAHKKLGLELAISSELPKYFLLDEHRLRQILMNLLANAVKFTDSGAIKVTIESTLLSTQNGSSKNNCALYFSIADTGIGIELDKQKKIFESFIQEDGSITRQYGGTGLGLAISTQLVELMGGKIKINSIKGQGSEFYFNIDTQYIIETKPLKTQFSGVHITLVGNELGFSETINHELLDNNINVSTKINYIQDLSPDNAVHTLIIYCQRDIDFTLKDIDYIGKLGGQKSIILVQQHTDKLYDFGSRIDGLVTMPILGARLFKTINSVLAHNTAISSQVSNKLEHTVGKAVILIVEDNLINQKVAELLLKQCGYECHIAINGQEAVAAVTSGNRYNTILMDCMMPVMDGFTATEHIRVWELQYSIKPTPIIALTASVLDADIQKCFDVGMNDYVPKPLNKSVLLEKIERLSHVA